MTHTVSVLLRSTSFKLFGHCNQIQCENIKATPPKGVDSDASVRPQTQFLASCDPDLWLFWIRDAVTQAALTVMCACQVWLTSLNSSWEISPKEIFVSYLGLVWSQSLTSWPKGDSFYNLAPHTTLHQNLFICLRNMALTNVVTYEWTDNSRTYWPTAARKHTNYQC